MKFFALVDRSYDLEQWQGRFSSGLAPAQTPYDFHLLAGEGDDIIFSRPTPAASTLRTRLVDGLGKVLQVDIRHAWANRAAIRAADWVVTHTEREYLGAAFMLRGKSHAAVRLQGNTLWAFYWGMPQGLAARLCFRLGMRRVDLLTANADPNFQRLRRSRKGASYIPFGVGRDVWSTSVDLERNDTVVVAGNDKARDWPLVMAVAERLPRLRFLVAAPRPLRVAVPDNVELVRPDGAAEMRELYARAGACLLAVQPNLHASGITVVLEAASQGTPVVFVGDGGVRRYFDEDEVAFCETGQVDAAVAALDEVFRDPARAAARAGRAQDRVRAQYLSHHFAQALRDEIEALT